MFLSQKEIAFFDHDDIFQHPNFNIYKKNHFGITPRFIKSLKRCGSFIQINLRVKKIL